LLLISTLVTIETQDTFVGGRDEGDMIPGNYLVSGYGKDNLQ